MRFRFGGWRVYLTREMNMSTPWNVGTLFTHNGRKFRAIHFLRIETYTLAGDDVGDEILRELLVEEGKDKPGLDFFRGVLHRFAELAVEAPTLSELLSTSAWLGMLGPVSERDAADALARAHARWDAKNPKDPLADAAGNRHHKDGSRCVDAGCQRAHAVPRRHLEPR